MSNTSNRRFYLKETPTDRLTPEHFELREEAVARPQTGEVLLKGHYLSLDAASRAWMQGATYRSAVTAGGPMAGLMLGEVVESGDPYFKTGDIVEGDGGWADYALLPARTLIKRKKMKPLSHLISLYGIAGRTAWFGMIETGRPRPGDTVVVSAAAGSVGVIASQLAANAGAHVVGIAGGDKKCQWLTKELGIAAVDYKSKDFFAALHAACPKGIDLYFDNVGGNVLEAALFQMAEFGRIVCCGAVSQYDTGQPGPGPRGVPGLMVVRRLAVQGFIVMDFMSRYNEADAHMRHLAEAGKLKVVEDIVDGLENTPAALCGLLAGDNTGKRLIKLV